MATGLKYGKRQVTVVIGFSLNLIGLENGASFLDQSQCKVKQNQCNSGLLSTLDWKLLPRVYT